MSTRRYAFVGAATGAATAALLVAASRVYNRRTFGRSPGVEGIESPEVSAGFARIASLPQMRLVRRIAIGHALTLAGGARTTGQAVDLGCGPGHLAVELAGAAPGLHVTGIDLSTALLSDALRRGIEAGLAHRLDFRTGDASVTPFANGSVDLVISTLSLHHWSNPVAVFDEISRILRPGGAFVIFDLRRDMIPPFYLLVWFASRFVVPQSLRHMGEPMGSRNAAYAPGELAALAQASQLAGWHIATGPFWLSIEGITKQ